MNYDICELKVLDNYQFRVKFKDNLEGIVIITKEWLTGVFAPLQDQNKFRKAFLHYGAVTWEVDGQVLDLAPDTMYEEIKKNKGTYLLKN